MIFSYCFPSRTQFLKGGEQVWGAKEAMDGEGGAEYTRDPALLSPNDPHQSTSTNIQTRETQNTLSYGSQHTHHPAHKYTTRSETVEDKTRQFSV